MNVSQKRKQKVSAVLLPVRQRRAGEERGEEPARGQLSEMRGTRIPSIHTYTSNGAWPRGRPPRRARPPDKGK